MDAIERWAEWLAEQYSGVTVRRDPEPVDVCRWHRELAEGIVARSDEQLRGAVDLVAAALANVRGALDPTVEGHLGLLRNAETWLDEALTTLGGGSGG